MQFHIGQQAFNGRLVDNALIKLSHNRIAYLSKFAQQSLVVALCIELNNKVAALYACYYGVKIGIDMNADEVRAIGLFLVFDINLVYQTCHTMSELHVRYDINRAAHTNGECIAYQAHAIKVGLTQVGTDGGAQLLGVKQGINTQLTVEQLIMTYNRGQRMSVIECCIGLDVTQIPTTVAQMVNLCISLQSTLVRKEIGAVSLGFYVSRYGIDRVARHKVMQVQIANAHICIVGHSLCYQITF